MARFSFGSRADAPSDAPTAPAGLPYRPSTLNGLYNSLAELTTALRREIDACSGSEVPELTTCELGVRDDAILPLLRPAIGPYADGGEHDLPADFKTTWTDSSENYPGLAQVLPKATIARILATPAGQPRQIVQRAASRALVQAIEAVDGFKYSFNNAWAAKDEEGLRFSYICQDSMQNKDRHANGFYKTTKHLKGEGERGPRKPTYDCKGSISVKFSQVRKCVEVFYRHYAIHSSVMERKAAKGLPRQKKGRRASGKVSASPVQPWLEEGALLGALPSEGPAYGAPGNVVRPPQPAKSRPPPSQQLKRKRGPEGPAAPPGDPNKPLSLAALLQQNEAAASRPAPEEPKPKDAAGSSAAPPVEYALPSWQAPPLPPPPPPPPPPAPPAAPHGLQYAPSGAQLYQPYRSTWDRTDYTPPYQPQQFQPQQQQPSPYLQGAPPVAIPRAPSQLQPRQEHMSVAARNQPPGMFTLKPVKREDHTTYEPHFIVYHSNRAKTSCHNCRVSKKKCDEGRPMCGSCARTNKLECIYETTPVGRADLWQSSSPPDPIPRPPLAQPASPRRSQTTQPTQVTTAPLQNLVPSQPRGPHDEAARRGISPDPWFPKR